MHVKVMEWLVRHHWDHPRRKYLAESIGKRLLRLGLVPSHYQWTEILNEQLSSFSGLLDPKVDRIPWKAVETSLHWLESNYTILHDAYQSAFESRRFQEHPEGIHLTGLWETAYISQDRCKAKRYPELCKLLEAIDEIWPKEAFSKWEAVQEARFARLHPGTLIVEHTADTNQRIKIHCGIENPSNVTMHIGQHDLSWQAGRCYLVDDSYAHHITSKATDEARTILELKVVHPDLAFADFLEDDGTVRPRKQRYELWGYQKSRRV